jgi:hypothetical protein
MHRNVMVNITDAAGNILASLAVDAEKIPAIELNLSAFLENHPGKGQESILLTLSPTSEKDEANLLRELAALT